MVLSAKQWYKAFSKAWNETGLCSAMDGLKDLNPNKMLWYELKKLPIKFEGSLKKYESGMIFIPVKKFQKLGDSMPNRISAVLKNKDFATKY